MKTKEKSIIARFWRLCPARHIISLVSAAVIGAYFLLRENYMLMEKLCASVIRPYHRAVGKLCSKVDFSVAEALYAVLIIFVLAYLTVSICLLIKRRERIKRLWLMAETLAMTALCIYAGFCVLWGVYYYGESFSESIGIETREISVEELYTVTAWFADKANKYGAEIDRDENGIYVCSRDELLDKAESLYDEVQIDFPYLQGPLLRPKGIHFSKIMSRINFTGFFFPFTGEANLNTDSPMCMFASTAAHELAHQRGVATEQEANFVGIMASMDSGDADYCYSASLLAYIHLGNALYSADYELWEKVSGSLEDYVWDDLRDNNLYWDQFEGKAAEVSETVYTGFLQSYGQTLGMKSYGACIDLLTAYYYETAAEELEAVR